MKKIFYTIFLFFIVVQFCAAQTDSAGNKKKQTAPWFVEKYRLSGGGFVPVNNTNIKISAVNGNIGTDIDFENDLGFEKLVGTFIGDFQFRIARRSRLNFSFYRFDRQSTYTISKDINVGNHVYTKSASVAAFTNTDVWRLSYGYAVLQKPRYELGLIIGAHLVDIKVKLNAKTNNGSISLKDTFGINQALPDVGIWGGYTFSNRFAVNGEIDLMAAKISNFSGYTIGSTVSILYHVANHLDVSLGYTGFNFTLNKTDPKYIKSIKWSYNGPSFTAIYSFGKKYWVQK